MFQVPNALDQPDQDQRQKLFTYNIAPGYQHTFSANALLTLNPFVRQDRAHYYPSPDSSNDTPATLQQDRQLTNWGVRGDFAYTTRRHNLKIGGQVMQTRLQENINLGITDFTFNAVCLNRAGEPQALPTVRTTAGCAPRGFVANPDFNPDLLSLDLTRGGSPFQFADTGHINEYAGYIQDTITLALPPAIETSTTSVSSRPLADMFKSTPTISGSTQPMHMISAFSSTRRSRSRSHGLNPNSMASLFA